MELNLDTKARPSLLRALRALLPAVLDKLGDPTGFRDIAAPILLRESDKAITDLKEADVLADRVHRAVTRLRGMHFRRLDTQQALDAAFKNLELSLNSSKANPVLSAGLWLAHRVHGAGLAFLDSREGQKAFAQAEAFLGAPPLAWIRVLGEETQPASVDRIEQELVNRLAPVLGAQTDRSGLYALSGKLLERARAAARQPPLLALPDAPPQEHTPAERLTEALAVPLRQADLAEAHARFTRLTTDETAKRFEEFKYKLLRAIPQAAEYAPLGLEPFCQAVESAIYPYPAQLEWLRSFVKPVWTNANQSTMFEGRNAPDLINQRYEHLRKTKQGNPIIIEMARAFALSLLRTPKEEQTSATFAEDLDLVAEFGWPATVDEMRRQWEKSAGTR